MLRNPNIKTNYIMKDPKRYRYCTYLNVERYSFIAFPHCVLGIYINLMLVLKRHAKFLLKSTGTQNSIINIVKPIQLKV